MEMDTFAGNNKINSLTFLTKNRREIENMDYSLQGFKENETTLYFLLPAASFIDCF